jgi:GAF domain-containing protein
MEMNYARLASDRRSQAAKLYARTAAVHERSARLLRAGGHGAAADHAELLAAVARDSISESAAVARMYLLARRFRDASRLGGLLDQALDGAVAFLAADFGNIQLTDPQTKTLRIVAQRGFASEFLDHFATVEDEQAVCGRAAKAGAQTVIADVNADPAFARHRAIAAGSGFRAVQSTPLIDKAGGLRGVLSTHFRRPHRPPVHELRMTETYATLVADAIARKLDFA